MTKQDKYYELMKRDKGSHDRRYSDDFDRRGEKRSREVLDAKYSRSRHDDHHRGRADYGERDMRDHKLKPSGVREKERGKLRSGMGLQN
jgi:hypothetical protein